MKEKESNTLARGQAAVGLETYYQTVEKVIEVAEVGIGNDNLAAELSEWLLVVRARIAAVPDGDAESHYLLRAAELEILTAVDADAQADFIKRTARKLLNQCREQESEGYRIVQASLFYCLSVVCHRHHLEKDAQQAERFLRLALGRHRWHWNAAVSLSNLGWENLQREFSEKLIDIAEKTPHPATRRYVCGEIALNFFCADEYAKAVNFWEEAEAVAPLKQIYYLDAMAQCLAEVGRFAAAARRLKASYERRLRNGLSLEADDQWVDHPLAAEIAGEAAEELDAHPGSVEHLVRFYMAARIIPADEYKMFNESVEAMLWEVFDDCAVERAAQKRAIADLNDSLQRKIETAGDGSLPFRYEMEESDADYAARIAALTAQALEMRADRR